MPSGIERVLLFRFGLLPAAVSMLMTSEEQMATLRDHWPRIRRALDLGFHCRSMQVMNSALNTNGVLLWSLGLYYPINAPRFADPAAVPTEAIAGSGLEPFVSFSGLIGTLEKRAAGAPSSDDADASMVTDPEPSASSPDAAAALTARIQAEFCPAFHTPTDDELAFLSELCITTVRAALADLEALAAAPPADAATSGLLRFKICSCIYRLTSIFSFGGPMLASYDRPALPGSPLGFVIGACPTDLCPGLRTDASDRLAALLPFMQGQDAQTQVAYAVCLERLLTPSASLNLISRMFSGLCDRDLEEPPHAFYALARAEGAGNLAPIRPQPRYARSFIGNLIVRAMLTPSLARTDLTTLHFERSMADLVPAELRVIEALCALAVSEYDQVRANSIGYLSKAASLCVGYAVILPRMLSAVRGEWDGKAPYDTTKRAVLEQ